VVTGHCARESTDSKKEHDERVHELSQLDSSLSDITLVFPTSTSVDSV